MKKLILIVALAGLMTARAGNDIVIDCKFPRDEAMHSKTKVPPAEILFKHGKVSEPWWMHNGWGEGYRILGTGRGRIATQADWANVGVQLRTVASEHGANVIAYELSGTDFYVQFLRIGNMVGDVRAWRVK
jgi:hypothetical protein